MPCVSLPNGAHNLPISFLPFFEKFERIYLWMDADEVGRDSAEKFARVLNLIIQNIETWSQKNFNY
jgi:hypothetical protein